MSSPRVFLPRPPMPHITPPNHTHALAAPHLHCLPLGSQGASSLPCQLSLEGFEGSLGSAVFIVARSSLALPRLNADSPGPSRAWSLDGSSPPKSSLGPCPGVAALYHRRLPGLFLVSASPRLLAGPSL